MNSREAAHKKRFGGQPPENLLNLILAGRLNSRNHVVAQLK